MSEVKELITDKDVEDIGAVVQLPPHANQTQLVAQSVNSEGDPLVSLDELYEKTGQESIDKICYGLRRLVKENKLDKQTALAIKMTGTESWAPGLSRINAVKGSEGFFTKLKDGIVYIVKAIIRFITGICNWIIDKFKVLFGFGKTSKEVEFLEKNSEEINNRMTSLYTATGRGVKFDMDLVKTLPSGYTDKEILGLYKNRMDNNADAIKRMEEAIPDIQNCLKSINELDRSIPQARKRYKRAMETLRRQIKSSGRVVEADLYEFSMIINEETFITLDTTNYFNSLAQLADKLFSIEVKDLGVNNSINTLNEKLKANIEKVKVTVDTESANIIDTEKKNLVPILVGLGDMKVPNNIVKDLKSFIEEDDAKIIDTIAEHGVAMETPLYSTLPQIYTTFCHRISEVTNSVNTSVNILTQILANYISITKWYYRTKVLIEAYYVRDLEEILKAHREHLTEDEKKALTDDNGNPKQLLDLVDAFERTYGADLTSALSNSSKILLEIDQIKKPIKNMMRQLGVSVRGL